MEVLNILAQHHDEWMRMVLSFGGDDHAEDIVQDCYLRVHKYAKPDKIVKDGKVNKAFMFTVLRNTYITYCKDIAKLKKVCLDQCDELEQQTEDLEYKKGQNKFFEKLEQEQNTWDWYDKLLFNHYMETGNSYRDISKNTRISLTSIWNTMSNCKQRIKTNLHEDWQDLTNQDYERI